MVGPGSSTAMYVEVVGFEESDGLGGTMARGTGREDMMVCASQSANDGSPVGCVV